MHHFHLKPPYQKPILRQIQWWVQNGPITSNGVSPVTTLYFWKFCFRLRTCYKELIWCTNDPNAHIRNFYKCWGFIWRCFFPLSIVNGSFAELTNWCDSFSKNILNFGELRVGYISLLTWNFTDIKIRLQRTKFSWHFW